ncbi:MAG TPA: formylglycine-generating enzyme family protein [Desulfobacterales bacterium]
MANTTINSIGIELVWIAPGSFTMGSDKKLEQAEDHETPQHPVTFKHGFFMGKVPVAQAQWSALMADNPSEFAGGHRPVEGVSWHDVQVFIEKLNTKEATDAYRLPTEAEWEYAARAGSDSAYTFGHDTSRLSQYAWYRKNAGDQTHSVGQLEPNAWGLHDMHGNVHEWCRDWFDRNYYSQSPSTDPPGPSSGLAKSLRGGDWGSEDWYCRCASRSLGSPDRRSSRLGFRLVRMASATVRGSAAACSPHRDLI